MGICVISNEATVNQVAVNSILHVFLWIYSFISNGYILNSGIAGP